MSDHRKQTKMAVLMVVVFIVVLTFALLPEFLPGISKKMVELVVEQSDEEEDMRQQLTNLQKELQSINMTDEFAKYAKTERKIAKLKQEIAKYVSKRSEVFLKMKFGTNVIFHILQVVCMVTMIWSLRAEPLILLPEAWLWPIHKVVAFPTGVTGAVGITTWLVVCRSVVAKGLKMVGR